MTIDTQTVNALPSAATSAGGVRRPPSEIAHRHRLQQHARAELAATARRERAQQRHTQADERRTLLDQLRAGRGITDTLTAVAQPQDTPADRVRRARLLREVLQQIDTGAVAIRGMDRRKMSRFLAFLEPEIAWLENVASDRPAPPRIAP
jgi:hypothetical protein